MVFSSLVFIFRFLPLFFIIYYLVPFKYKNLILLLGSMFFYAYGEPRFLILIIASIVINFFCAESIFSAEEGGRKRKVFFLLALIYDIGSLVVFKYTDFILENINNLTGAGIPLPGLTLPLGISFYTFQIMSYVIDVYRKKCPSSHNLVNLGTYLVMFPQLIAGPIVVYNEVSQRLKKRRIASHDVEEGLKKFTLGLGMKVIFANNIGGIWNTCLEEGFENLSTPMAWLGILSFSLQLYYDFGGYSMMAIGLGQMLGFKFPKNFDYPYIANSVTDFWRRWHMTLTSWFREYIYIPLGGNRKGVLRTILNMLVVWLITGLWHGAAWNFVVWGLYYFVLLVLERFVLKKVLDKIPVLPHIYTLVIVMCGWVLFQAPSLSEALVFISRMFTLNPGTEFIDPLKQNALFLIPAMICATPVFSGIYLKSKKKWYGIAVLFLIFWGSVVLLVDSVYNPFLYFRF